MKVKPPKKTITVELDEWEVSLLLDAAEQVRKVHEKQAEENRLFYRNNGHWPPAMGVISGSTFTFLTDLAEAVKEARSA